MAGRTRARAGDHFGADEVARARRYHRPRYVAMAVDQALALGWLAAAALSPLGPWLARPPARLPWWGAVPALTALVVGLSAVLRLPLSFWRGHRHERRWGFSTQTVGGWLADRAKALAVGLVLASGVLTGLVGLARALPGTWPAVAAPALAGLVLVVGFLAPVVLEPLFLRFVPLPDPALAGDLAALSRRAGVPVREVLVADASRRTRKENAYVSGLGRTRRVVVFDTLLARADPRQVRVVVAHELGHRRRRHVARGTALGMAGAALGVVALWAAAGSEAVLRAAGAAGPGDPRVVPLALLVAWALEVVSSPLGAAISRRWEREADRISLELTRDLQAYEASHRDLARRNLLDLDPPRALYLLAFTHPTPAERIAAGRRWASSRGAPPPCS